MHHVAKRGEIMNFQACEASLEALQFFASVMCAEPRSILGLSREQNQGRGYDTTPARFSFLSAIQDRIDEAMPRIEVQHDAALGGRPSPSFRDKRGPLGRQPRIAMLQHFGEALG
jgi:hypothetical protein